MHYRDDSKLQEIAHMLCRPSPCLNGTNPQSLSTNRYKVTIELLPNQSSCTLAPQETGMACVTMFFLVHVVAHHETNI